MDEKNAAPKRRRAGRRDFGSIYADGSATDLRFSVMWWEGGKRRRKRGFRTRGDAGAFLARVRTALSDGVLQAERRADVALATVGEEWLRTHSAVRLRSHDANTIRWATLSDFFGVTAKLSEVVPSRILELRERLNGKGLKPGTVNRCLALLRTVLNYAVTAGYLQLSPVRRFARGAYLLPEPKPKRSPPLATNGEGARLLGKIRDHNPEWFPFFAFLLLTGARRGEAAGLHWDDVDLVRRIVTIRRSYDSPPKSGKARTVPISAELAAILADHRKRDPWGGSAVFFHPATGQGLTPDVRMGGVLDVACNAAGIPRMRVHDMRHAHASLWLMAGGSLADVQRNLGHSTPVLTSETYGHIAEDHRVREADQRLALGLPQPGPRAMAGEPGALMEGNPES
jgi:integrase